MCILQCVVSKIINQLDIITTKFGDNGMTNLVYKNVLKTDPIIICIGLIDNANAQIGAQVFIYKHILVDFKQTLHNIQNQLFDLSADLICNTEKICDIHIDKIKSITQAVEAMKFSPLQDSINAVDNAKNAFDYLNNMGHYPREYLAALSGFLQYLSQYVYEKTPWCIFISQIVEVMAKIDLTELLCSKFMEELKPIISIIKGDLQLLCEDVMHYRGHIQEEYIARLELHTENLNQSMPPLNSFIIPIGPSAPMHNVRTSVRIAEIKLLNYLGALDQDPYSNALIMRKYMNRLSDLIFVMCRKINHEAENSEDLWVRIGNE